MNKGNTSRIPAELAIIIIAITIMGLGLFFLFVNIEDKQPPEDSTSLRFSFPNVNEIQAQKKPSLRPTQAALANLIERLKVNGFTFTAEDELYFREQNMHEGFYHHSSQLHESMKNRFNSQQDTILSAAEDPKATEEMRRLVLRIVAKATDFDSPRMHKLLIAQLQSSLNSSRSEAISILASIPQVTLPLNISYILEKQVITSGKDRSDALIGLYALRAIRHFEEDNPMILDRLGKHFANRSKNALFDEAAGFHKDNPPHSLENKCAPFNGLALRDSFTYELAQQIAVHSQDLSLLLLEFIKSSDPTLQFIAYESLRKRSILTEQSLPIIKSFEEYLDTSAPSKAYDYCFALKIPEHHQSALGKMQQELQSSAAKKCLSSPSFLSLIAQGGKVGFNIIASEFDREYSTNRSYSIAANMMAEMEEIDTIGENQILNRLIAHYNCQCRNTKYLRSLTKALSRVIHPSNESIQFLIKVLREPLPECIYDTSLTEGATDAMLLLALRDKKYLRMLVEIPNFVVNSRSFIFLRDLRKSNDSEVQSMIKDLDRRVASVKPTTVPIINKNPNSSYIRKEAKIITNKLMYEFTHNDEPRIDELLSQLKYGEANIMTSGKTLLSEVCRRYPPSVAKIVKTLLEKGADPNLTEDDGTTPLMNASRHPTDEVVKMLITSGANLNSIKNINGLPNTALLVAIENIRVQTAETLLESGADPNIGRDFTTRLPPFFTMLKHCPDRKLANLMVEKGLDPYFTNHLGQTALEAGLDLLSEASKRQLQNSSKSFCPSLSSI